MRAFLFNEPYIPIAIVILIVALIAILIFYFDKKQVVIRKLAKINPKPIGSLKTNELSKITGKALHVKEPLIAPFSKRPCIFYSIKIEQKRATAKAAIGELLLVKRNFRNFL